MSTTNLFVELIVIGIGTTIWIVLLVLSVFGYEWIPYEQALSLPALIPVLSIIYVLGIVTDRIADALFHHLWIASLRRDYARSESHDFDDRRLIYIRSERLADLLEYGRSRLRICRGWAFNTVGILITLHLFVWTRVADRVLRGQLAIFGTLCLLTLIASLWFAWRQLVITDYRKVRDQAAYLRRLEQDDTPQAHQKPPRK